MVADEVLRECQYDCAFVSVDARRIGYSEHLKGSPSPPDDVLRKKQAKEAAKHAARHGVMPLC